MIFINRRGYSSFVRCRSCGYVPKCTSCEVSLTYHREDETLKCHYCGKAFHAINECPNCGFTHLKEGKLGTQKIVLLLNEIFKDAKILRMDFDTTQGKNATAKILKDFAEKKADILVGTQMIAKGHDFPLVTLVGILDADQSLFLQDYRSRERTFQLITQVAGRAGREQKAGRVIMQTYAPNQFVYRYITSYDYKGFFKKEINDREVSKFPPFTKIIRILVLSKDEELAKQAVAEIHKRQKDLMNEHKEDIIRVQVMRAPIKRIENNFRFQIIIWVKNKQDEKTIDLIYENAKTEVKNASVFVEVNPQTMY
jgi:primosomal protein N' (replication factor Y)